MATAYVYCRVRFSWWVSGFGSSLQLRFLFVYLRLSVGGILGTMQPGSIQPCMNDCLARLKYLVLFSESGV
ncbi:hypothetical protein B0J12DRAFT_288218 [Macrophomina phaseolina]|uniref:Secreted protein n=1 Tax=Macrophomina phaseolina TaxID=35725 RepID=A0ABQ8GNE6_9PEZI|nr:hypothetical protein B0J12DRAFT_288218 [Macrophomina phaseolina]